MEVDVALGVAVAVVAVGTVAAAAVPGRDEVHQIGYKPDLGSLGSGRLEAPGGGKAAEAAVVVGKKETGGVEQDDDGVVCEAAALDRKHVQEAYGARVLHARAVRRRSTAAHPNHPFAGSLEEHWPSFGWDPHNRWAP